MARGFITYLIQINFGTYVFRNLLQLTDFHTLLFSYMTPYWITTILNSRRWGLDHLLLWGRAQIYCMDKTVLEKTRQKAELLCLIPVSKLGTDNSYQK